MNRLVLPQTRFTLLTFQKRYSNWSRYLRYGKPVPTHYFPKHHFMKQLPDRYHGLPPQIRPLLPSPEQFVRHLPNIYHIPEVELERDPRQPENLKPGQRWANTSTYLLDNYSMEVGDIEDNSIYKFAQNVTEEELEKMTLEEIEKVVEPMDALSLLMTLPEEDMRIIWRRIEYECLPFFHYIKNELEAHEELLAYPPHWKETQIHDHQIQKLYSVAEEAGFDLEDDNPETRELIIDFINLSDKAKLVLDPRNVQVDEDIRTIRKDFISTDCGDKMWQLHKANPRYWTGDRLGRAFGVPRSVAWGEIILREVEEAERTGKPFCYEKLDLIFRPDREYEERTNFRLFEQRIGEYNMKFLSEEEAYKNFLEVTSKEGLPGGYDDELPDWAALPFQKRKPTGFIEAPFEYEPVELPFPKPFVDSKGRQWGTVLRRRKIVFVEYGSHVNDRNRRFRVREKNGVLRTATWMEIDFMGRKGSFPSPRHPWGKAWERRKRLANRIDIPLTPQQEKKRRIKKAIIKKRIKRRRYGKK